VKYITGEKKGDVHYWGINPPVILGQI